MEYEPRYKSACRFGDSEGYAHIYDSVGGIDSSTFTRIQLLSIYLNHLMCEYRIPREAYRKIVRFVNTCIRDHELIMSGI